MPPRGAEQAFDFLRLQGADFSLADAWGCYPFGRVVVAPFAPYAFVEESAEDGSGFYAP